MASGNYDKIQQLYSKFVVGKFPAFEQILKQKQAEIIEALLDGKDSLALLPTSFGKSLCMYAPGIIKCQVGLELIMPNLLLQVVRSIWESHVSLYCRFNHIQLLQSLFHR